MSELRQFLDSTLGKAVSVGLCVLALLIVGVVLYRTFVNSDVAAANERYFIDAKTGKAFQHTLKIGESFPIRAPSGNESGYPAELCYWTADGKIKDKPTVVLLKSWLGEAGPTFCPDCKRLVVGHNPRPGPGARPPPTQDEYKPSKRDR
jgi:hypothetical protein